MSAGRTKQRGTGQGRSARPVPAVLAATGGALVLVVLAGAGARELHDRIGLRNAVYTLLAATLLIAVCVEAIHHRFVDRGSAAEITPARSGAWMLTDPAWAIASAGDTTASDDPLAQELQLAARLGAELMGETPASRIGDGRRAAAA